MHNRILTAGAVIGALMLPVAAYAQGGVGIADDNRTRFQAYVVQQNTPSYAYSSEVIVGAELPTAGVTYYDVPAEYGTQYRYTVVNKRTVLVDPKTRLIIQVIQ